MNSVEILPMLIGIIAVVVSLVTATGAVKQSAFDNLARYVEKLEKRLTLVEAERDAVEVRLQEVEDERDSLRAKIAENERNFNDEKNKLIERNAELQAEIEKLRNRMDALNSPSD